MKSRIPKIWLALAFALPAYYGTTRGKGTELFDKLATDALFYANVPARLCEVVTNLKTLPERMEPPALSAISSNP
jgi:hypothetical protein